ncbi:MAG: hypothetical protein NTU53_16370 [Planctomycetota bacterium]|nr:hypothetical protein [Planctomycetota bacterium]
MVLSVVLPTLFRDNPIPFLMDRGELGDAGFPFTPGAEILRRADSFLARESVLVGGGDLVVANVRQEPLASFMPEDPRRVAGWLYQVRQLTAYSTSDLTQPALATVGAWDSHYRIVGKVGKSKWRRLRDCGLLVLQR